MEDIFKTKRLIVKQLMLEDLASFILMECDPQVKRYTDVQPVLSDQHVIDDFHKLRQNYSLQDPQVLVYAVRIRSHDLFAGTIGFVFSDTEAIDIGYRLLPNYWGQGLATELVEGQIAFARSAWPQKRLTAVCCSQNEASITILDKFMKRTHHSYNEDFKDDDIFYSFDFY